MITRRALRVEPSFVATTKTRSVESMSDSFALSPFSRTLVLSLSAYVSTKSSLLFTVSDVRLTLCSFLGDLVAHRFRCPLWAPKAPTHADEDRPSATLQFFWGAARVQLEPQRLGHQIPSSLSMVRRSGRLKPTTLW